MKQRRPANPFLLTGYHSPKYFCNREEELKWLREQLRNEHNVVLHADRRIGKSALVKHLFYFLQKEKQSETVFVDLLGTTDLHSANQRIAKVLIDKYGNLAKGLVPKLLKVISSVGASLSVDPVTGFPKFAFTSSPGQPHIQSLQAIGDYLKTSKKQIVICLDEFQVIAKYPEQEAEALFRTWTQEYPMIRFIFSGSHQSLLQSMFTDKARPFYRSAQLKNLEEIPYTPYRDFIVRHFKEHKKAIDEDVIRYIMDWTWGQTYYVQLICNKLFSSSSAGLDQAKKICISIIEQEIPHLSVYQSLMTLFQWKVLVAIARDENVANPLSKDFILHHALGTPSSVSTALKKLTQINLVIKRAAGYRVQDILLMRWLQTL